MPVAFVLSGLRTDSAKYKLRISECGSDSASIEEALFVCFLRKGCEQNGPKFVLHSFLPFCYLHQIYQHVIVKLIYKLSHSVKL